MADIKLKDFSGESDKYTNVPKVLLESADSTEENLVLLPFSYGEAVSRSVDPDFSAGDMTVDIPSGQLVSELTIKKPATLIPGNIADGVNIAGVIGSLITGGGSGGKYIAVQGYITTDNNPGRTTVTHGLGVMPDAVIVMHNTWHVGSLEEYIAEFPAECIWGIQSKFSCNIKGGVMIPAYPTLLGGNYGIENLPSSDRQAGFIYCPNETTFEVGSPSNNNTGKLAKNTRYVWIAFANVNEN